MNRAARDGFWLVLTIAVVVRACVFPASSWDDHYRNADPAARLVLDRQVLARVQQYNVDHGRPADTGVDAADAQRRVDADLAILKKDIERGKTD